MNDEIIALKKNKTFDIVNKPIARNIVASKWAFKTKQNADSTLETFRARAVGLKDFLKLLASTLKTPLLRLFGMSHSDYSLRYAPETNSDRDSSTSNLPSFMVN